MSGCIEKDVAQTGKGDVKKISSNDFHILSMDKNLNFPGINLAR